MGEKSDQIERHIRTQRDELGDNISELEQKMKGLFDWRVQFEQRTGTMLGLALAGGALLGAILPSSSSVTSRVTSRRRSFSGSKSPSTNDRAQPAGSAASVASAPLPSSVSSSPPGGWTPRSSETWDNLRNAAIGVATARLSELIEGLVPGFAEHYKKAAGNASTGSAKAVWPYSATPPGTTLASDEKSWQKPNGGTDYASHS